MDSESLATVPPGQPDLRGPAPVRSGAVPPLADCFSNRPESAGGLAQALTLGQAVALTAAESRSRHQPDWPGGTGKTQLAAYLAGSLWHAGQAEVLVWVTATSRASIMASYAQASGPSAGPAPGGDAETAATRFTGWLASTGRPWLVVLDDLADPADLDGLWPAGPAGRVLITTRDPDALSQLPNPLVFPVGVFSPHEALTYLMGRLSTDPDQRVGAVDLLSDLGREPLALAQASATIASSGLSCRDYRDLFARRREQIADAVGGEPSAKAVTWTLSIEQADQLSAGRLAQACLALASLLDCHGIPGEVFTTQAVCEFVAAFGAGGIPDPKRTRGALLSLERTGLLTIDQASTARTVRIHPVVQAAVRAATPEQMRDQAAAAAARALLQAWPADGARAGLADALRCCASSLQEAAAGALWAAGGHALLFQAGRSLDSAGLTGPAVGHWQALAVASERMLGPGHQDTLTAADRLASALLAAGRGTEAVLLYQRTADARTRVLGPDHPTTLAAQTDLGNALLAAGQPARAITVLEGVLAAGDRGSVPDGTDPLAVQDLLVAAYQQAGRPHDAIRQARRTLADRERRDGADHPGTMATRASLASGYLAAGRMKDAVATSQRTLADRDRVLGPDHPDTIASVSALATAYHTARRLKDALPLFERALTSREQVHGPDHPETLGAMGNLASAYHSAGRMASALPLYERNRTDCQRVLGAHHPDTLAARANLAHAYYAVGRVPEARALLRDTLADCERVLPAGDSLTAAVRESLDAVARG
ncbi:MAG TPA: tetratricopeptide repeat protein [Streptosporangiaceae bacterium]